MSDVATAPKTLQFSGTDEAKVLDNVHKRLGPDAEIVSRKAEPVGRRGQKKIIIRARAATPAAPATTASAVAAIDPAVAFADTVEPSGELSARDRALLELAAAGPEGQRTKGGFEEVLAEAMTAIDPSEVAPIDAPVLDPGTTVLGADDSDPVEVADEVDEAAEAAAAEITDATDTPLEEAPMSPEAPTAAPVAAEPIAAEPIAAEPIAGPAGLPLALCPDGAINTFSLIGALTEVTYAEDVPPACEEILVVVGELMPAVERAAAYDAETAVVVTTELPGTPDTWAWAGNLAALVPVKASRSGRDANPLVVAVDINHPQLDRILETLRADHVRAALDADAAPAVIEATLAAAGPGPVVDLVATAESVNPARILGYDACVSTIDHRPATPELWAALIVERAAKS